MKTKKLLTLIITAVIILCVVPAIAMSANATETSGTTGDCTWTLDGTVLTISGNGTMENYSSGTSIPWGTSITKVVIQPGVTYIGRYAFYNCSRLSSVLIPDSVLGIQDYAFYNCSSLTSITIPDSVRFIRSNVLSGCSSLESITIPFVGSAQPSTTRAGCGFGYIFGTLSYSGSTATETYYYTQGTWLSSDFYIPNSLKSVTVTGGEIPYRAFQNCSGLTSITLPESATSIDGCTFVDCSSLTSLTLPKGVTSIGYMAFRDCTSLNSVTIPDSVISIGSSAFLGCSSLISVTIPNSVTSIGAKAFYACKGLTGITIPNSVTSIGDSAFSGCSSLTSIIFEGDAPSFGSDCFYRYIETITTAYYPAGNETWTEDVMQDYGGTITWVPYEAVKAVDEWNLVLDDDLKVCFYLSADIEETATVSVTVGDSTKNSTVSSLEKGEDGRYIVTVQIAAAQMNDTITLKVTDGTQKYEKAKYTVRQYCDTVLGDESYSSYHALVKEMLNYGAMAQMYFDHNTQNLANEGIAGTAAQQIPEKANGQTVTGKLSGVRFYGASLVYRDRIAVRYYFTGDVSSCTFTANGNIYTPVGNGNICYVEIGDILPQNIDQQITLTATDAAGNTLTVAYGPMDYIVRMNAKGGDSLKNLLKALYNYHLAAKALRV